MRKKYWLWLSLACVISASASTVSNLQVVANSIVSSCCYYAKPMSELLYKNANAIVVTNEWNASVNVVNGITNSTYSYAVLDGFAYPNWVRVRNEDGDGFDVNFNKWLRPTKYQEYKHGRLHGLYLEFYTNNLVKTYMNFSNDWIVGEQVMFDENGRVVRSGNMRMPIGDLIVVRPPGKK